MNVNENNQYTDPYQGQQFQQQPYQQPMYQPSYQNNNNLYQSSGSGLDMTVGDWLLTWLVLIIPCLNVIMIFIWAFGKGDSVKPSKRTFARAYLLLVAIMFVFMIIVSVALGGIISITLS